jgi:DNA-binding Xre family transcriptional regulator
MDTLSERLKEAMGAMQPPELASRIGVTKQTIYNLLDGVTKADKVRAVTLFAICEVLSIQPEWLLYGRSPLHTGSQQARPDPVILARAVTVLKHLSRMQAGEATFLYDAPSILAIYEQVSREPPDIELDREAVLGRMAAVLRGVSNDEGMGRSDALGAGGNAVGANGRHP